ncbi:RDD family protein [Aureibaculum sp. 2210JD6-5]|uniref:RDD family protein n=1 Tax=Aureibaculum sp. 2210JD6-5 TaxID=3103957 RepID=UPI002AAE1EEB|nr:RDD family protein [Aureibaculum sp. 2210JD6-5]MDY7394740.1 RDD family protein [Aureibaculum sp. 2210JD6-5]
MEVLNYKEFRVTDEMLAGKGKRLLNYIIDIAFFYSLFFLLGMVLYLIAKIMANEELITFLLELENFNPIIDRLLTAVLLVIYYVVLESLSQKSIGKLITRSKVVLENGEKPPFEVFIKRSLCRIIPFDQLSFLGKKGWHDSISKTFVVDDKIFNEQKTHHKNYQQLGSKDL